MAIPTIPLEIWAQNDIILPVAKTKNKERPIEDLWLKGYDKTEKPSAEEFNYVFNMVTTWMDYITNEQLNGLDARFLTKDNNLSDVADKAIARSNLDVFSKSESDTRYVNIGGDTMTGPLTVPRINFPSGASDQAYITTSVPGADWTYLDLVVSDNPGTPGGANIDAIRFRFIPSGGAEFSMMELNALSATTAQATIRGNLVASGLVQGNSVTGVQGNFTNLSVNNTMSAGTVSATNINGTNISAGGTVTGNTVNATGSMTTPYIRVNGEANTNSLVVNNNWAVVGGRHVVRAINGNGADANGNVNLPLPPAGVQSIRWSGPTAYQERRGAERDNGGVMTTWADYGGSNYWITLRRLEYLINGSWVTARYS